MYVSASTVTVSLSLNTGNSELIPEPPLQTTAYLYIGHHRVNIDLYYRNTNESQTRISLVASAIHILMNDVAETTNCIRRCCELVAMNSFNYIKQLPVYNGRVFKQI